MGVRQSEESLPTLWKKDRGFFQLTVGGSGHLRKAKRLLLFESACRRRSEKRLQPFFGYHPETPALTEGQEVGRGHPGKKGYHFFRAEEKRSFELPVFPVGVGGATPPDKLEKTQLRFSDAREK